MCILPKANFPRHICAAAFAALLLMSDGGHVSNAATGCLNSAHSLSQTEIDAFLAEPSALLERFPTGGPALSTYVQRLAATDTATVSALIALAESAKPAHVVALSTGLGRAAAHCSAKRPDIAFAIKELVAAKGSASLRALFTSEATVTELALGAPAEREQSLARGEAPTADNRPGAPNGETLTAIIKARAPSILLPTSLATQQVAASRPISAPLGRTEEPSSSPSAEGASASPPPPESPDQGFPSLGDEGSIFRFFAAGRSASPPPDDDHEHHSPDSITGWWDHDDKYHWTQNGDGSPHPSFGNGGLVESSKNVTSPAR
jgi:hypothetical protein